MTEAIGRARAHTNIALIKYWGKRDKTLFLPMNSSLSMTLDAFYTDTQVTFDEALAEDTFFLNGVLQTEEERRKITAFLDLFRGEIAETRRACVVSYNFVPTAAGLASSASAFAALALSINQALGLKKDTQALSTYARRGSGSSTRSLFGGFVEWEMGTCSEDSLAVPIEDATWDVGMLVLVLSSEKKAVASRVGMEHTVATSPFYPAWVSSAKKDLVAIKQAIGARDFKQMGKIAEHNSMKMHATTLSSNPPFTYWTPESIRMQQLVRQIREETGIEAYMTMDAGPNVKVLCQVSDMERLVERFAQHLPKEKIITSLLGPDAYYLSEKDWQASKDRFYAKTD